MQKKRLSFVKSGCRTTRRTLICTCVWAILYLARHLDIYNSSQYIDEAITEYQRALETYRTRLRFILKSVRRSFSKATWKKRLIILICRLKMTKSITNHIICLLKPILKKQGSLMLSFMPKRLLNTDLSEILSCAHFLLANI